MIFISYSWEDSVFVRSLANHLRAKGHNIWVDYDQLDLSVPLGPQLVRAISVAKVFFLVDSPAARDSKWVRLELSIARGCNKPTRIIQTLNA
jgi:hypothetical protein